MHRVEPLPRFRNGVVLRRLSAADLAAFQAYRQDVLLGRYQGWGPTTDAEATLFLTQMNTAPLLEPGVWTQIGIAGSGDGALIGDIGLLLAADGQQATIGFTLRRESQGNGIATHAVLEAMNLVFEHTEARTVIAVTDARNVPSIRLLERVGMHRMATGAAWFRGEACVEHTYALSRPEDDQ